MPRYRTEGRYGELREFYHWGNCEAAVVRMSVEPLEGVRQPILLVSYHGSRHAASRAAARAQSLSEGLTVFYRVEGVQPVEAEINSGKDLTSSRQ